MAQTIDMHGRPDVPPRRHLTKLLPVAALSAALLSGAQGAQALPSEGERAPNARVEDADGHELQMRALKGKPVLIVYEDRDSAKQNQRLKDDLAKLAKGDRYKRAIALAAIADVSSYDFWPVKGFVKDAIRSESRKIGATIYCDWDGTFRSTYRLRRGVSNIILIGKSGEVLFAAAGVLKQDAQRKLIDLLRKEVEG